MYRLSFSSIDQVVMDLVCSLWIMLSFEHGLSSLVWVESDLKDRTRLSSPSPHSEDSVRPTIYKPKALFIMPIRSIYHNKENLTRKLSETIRIACKSSGHNSQKFRNCD